MNQDAVGGVLLFSTGVGLLILVKNKYGLDGIVGGALVLVTSSLVVWYSVNNLLYVLGNPPTKLSDLLDLSSIGIGGGTIAADVGLCGGP